MGQHESKGLKKGVVVNIETTVSSIQRALEEAELMADCKIRDVYTGIAGSHIKSFNSSGMVAIKDKEVTSTDVARVIETAKAVSIPGDQQMLHVLDAGVHRRRPGRRPRAARHERHAPRGQGPHRDRRRQRRAEHRQVRAALRAGSAGPDPAAARIQPRRADRRRERNWAWCSSTSAAARPTSRSSPAARSVTPR